MSPNITHTSSSNRFTSDLAETPSNESSTLVLLGKGSFGEVRLLPGDAGLAIKYTLVGDKVWSAQLLIESET
jgi:hypothetical protein